MAKAAAILFGWLVLASLTLAGFHYLVRRNKRQ